MAYVDKRTGIWIVSDEEKAEARKAELDMIEEKAHLFTSDELEILRKGTKACLGTCWDLTPEFEEKYGDVGITFWDIEDKHLGIFEPEGPYIIIW